MFKTLRLSLVLFALVAFVAITINAAKPLSIDLAAQAQGHQRRQPVQNDKKHTVQHQSVYNRSNRNKRDVMDIVKDIKKAWEIYQKGQKAEEKIENLEHGVTHPHIKLRRDVSAVSGQESLVRRNNKAAGQAAHSRARVEKNKLPQVADNEKLVSPRVRRDIDGVDHVLAINGQKPIIRKKREGGDEGGGDDDDDNNHKHNNRNRHRNDDRDRRRHRSWGW